MEIQKIKRYLPLFLILSLALFFRFWKLKEFQYWSDDEQLLWMIIRHIIIDKHLSLAVPNSALEIGLGPLFHYILIPWFLLVKLNPERILLFGNIFSLLNILMFYLTGKLLGGRKIGLIAAFLYSTSFMASLFDRRLWALTPNVFLILVGIYSLIKIANGKIKYILLLTIPTAFAFNSDPSLGVIVLSALIILLALRPKIKLKYVLTTLGLFTLLLSPLIFFQLRHSIQKIRTINASNNLSMDSITTQAENLSRFFYASPTKAADAYFCYCTLDEKRPLLITGATISILLYFVFLTIKIKSKSYFILLTTLLSYLAGIFIFKTYLNGNPAFFYSITISPILFLILATVISKFSKSILYTFLSIYLFVNLYTLVNSGFKYPLPEKLLLVSQTVTKIPDKNNFSLYYSGDILLAGGGWTSLFIYKEYVPQRGNLSLYWGHVYESYQLYPKKFSNQDPNTIVILTTTNNKASSYFYDNTKGNFNYKIDLEELYQPKYFND